MASRRGVEHRRLVQVHAVLVEPDRDAGVVQVQHLGPLVEQDALRQSRRATGVHEDHRVGLVGLGRHDRLAALEQLLVAHVVRHVTVADEHDAFDARVVTHRVDDACEQRVDEDRARVRVAQDERQLGRAQPQVERVDDPGAEEAGVVQLEVLVSVAGDDRVAVGSRDAELGPQGRGEAQHPLDVLAERRVVAVVVETDPIGRAVRDGEKQSCEHQLLHGRTVRPRSGPCDSTSAVRVGTIGPGPRRILAVASIPGFSHGRTTRSAHA